MAGNQRRHARRRQRVRLTGPDPELVCAGSWWESGTGICGRCSGRLTGQQQWFCSADCKSIYARNHWWTDARKAAVKRDLSCVLPDCDAVTELEVNHMLPREGRGYGNGCHHHQTNLETLCHDHHLVVTTREREVRAAREARGIVRIGWGVNLYAEVGDEDVWVCGAADDEAYVYDEPFDAERAAIVQLHASYKDLLNRADPWLSYPQFGVVTEVLHHPDEGRMWSKEAQVYRPFFVRTRWIAPVAS